MKRRLAGWMPLVVVAIAIPGVLPQQAATHGETPMEKAEDKAGAEDRGNLIWWKWANFALLAGGIGYVLRKNAGPFFSNRTQQIRQGIHDAEKLHAHAEARMADVNARLSRLSEEIEQMRREAAAEQASEAERSRAALKRDLEKMHASAEQEIVAAGKAARQQLKGYSAELALALAEKKLRARMSPQAEDELIQHFVRQLSQPISRAQVI
jgi:F0F1-type ATP synthase membrane subunit b/b'